MGRLIKGMYDTEFRSTGTLFGLHCCQMRGGPNGVTHNSGWYNRQGEKLGWGDLDANDFQRISRELQDGEFFVILSESDSFWNFVTRLGAIGSMCETRPDVNAPGPDYVAEKALYVIVPGAVYVVDQRGWYKKATMTIRGGLTANVLKKDAVKALLTS